MSRVIAEHTFPSGQILRLVHGDLTAERVDAIVNAANSMLAHGGGVAGAIVRRGGSEIQEESDAWVRAHGPVSHERPAITGAGRLPSRRVIHAVGPVWGAGDEDRKLGAAVAGALRAAEEYGLETIALPAISMGIFGFPKERGAGVLLTAVADHLEARPASPLKEVRVTLIDGPTLEVFAQEFRARWPDSLRER
jgi:putative ATPase